MKQFIKNTFQHLLFLLVMWLIFSLLLIKYAEYPLLRVGLGLMYGGVFLIICMGLKKLNKFRTTTVSDLMGKSYSSGNMNSLVMLHDNHNENDFAAPEEKPKMSYKLIKWDGRMPFILGFAAIVIGLIISIQY